MLGLGDTVEIVLLQAFSYSLSENMISAKGIFSPNNIFFMRE